MNILVGCEFSGVVRDAFLRKGHDAISCDLLPSEAPGPHFQGDIMNILERRRFDMIIVHPDCTAVCNAGNRHYGEGKEFYYERLASVQWIKQLWRKCRLVCPKICFENPAGVLPVLARLPVPHFVQPYMFGHPEQKRTGLYLHGLPKLVPTEIVYEEMMALPRHMREAVFYMGPSEDRWKDRARTYWGIADAMAKQWG